MGKPKRQAQQGKQDNSTTADVTNTCRKQII